MALRILLSPLAFLYGAFIVFGGLIFPTTLIIMFSFVQLVSYPFILLFNKAGSEIKVEDPFINEYNSTAFNYFLGATILIWVPFWSAYIFVRTGKLLLAEK